MPASGWPGKATNQLRHDLALHLLRLDLPFHKAHVPGELIERIDGDAWAWPTSSRSSACTPPATPGWSPASW